MLLSSKMCMGFGVADNGVMKGGWEYVVPDQEVLAVLARVPDLYG